MEHAVHILTRYYQNRGGTLLLNGAHDARIWHAHFKQKWPKNLPPIIDIAPIITPQITPQITHETAAQIASQITPQIAPQIAPDTAPKITPPLSNLEIETALYSLADLYIGVDSFAANLAINTDLPALVICAKPSDSLTYRPYIQIITPAADLPISSIDAHQFFTALNRLAPLNRLAHIS